MLEWNRPRCDKPKHDARGPKFRPGPLLCPLDKHFDVKGYPEAELTREQKPGAVDATDLMRSRPEFPECFKVIPFSRRIAYNYTDFGLRPGFFLTSGSGCGSGSGSGSGSAKGAFTTS